MVAKTVAWHVSPRIARWGLALWLFGTLVSAQSLQPAPDSLAVGRAALAVPFESNAGQFDPVVAYAAHTFAGVLFVTREGQLVHVLGAPRVATRSAQARAREVTTREPARHGWSLVETLVGAARLSPRGDDVTPTRVSRFIGSDPSRWQSDVATYGQIRLGEAWPGITVDLVARGNNVEKLFTLAPGADPERIKVKVRGTRRLHLSPDGTLIADTGNGPVTFSRPAAYQEIGGIRRPVAVRYQLTRARTYQLRLGVYDAALAVTIDPLLQATYLGGSNGDIAFAIALAGGDVYVAGGTFSTDFPGTAGGSQTSNAGPEDVVVAKLSGDLKTLIRATYLGGTSSEVAYALAVDGSGNVFVAGVTSSTDFAGTAGGAQTSNGGGQDAFVARLTGDLKTLTQATYLGGSGLVEGASSLAVDGNGDVYVAGGTDSSNFPGVSGGYQTSLSGGNDAFIAKLTNDLKTLTQATYLGGSAGDNALALLASGGNVYVAGATSSGDFPGTLGGAQPNHAADGGTTDAFIAILAGNLQTLTQATYLGGNGIDGAYGVALDGIGNVYVAGLTFSSDLPGVGGGAQPVYGGSGDAFVAKLSANLQTLHQSTYLGGSGAEVGTLAHLALDANGNVYVAGSTTSTDFPGTSRGAQRTHASDGGGTDAFVVKLPANLQSLTQATYLGGNGNDDAYGLVLDGGGNVYVTGVTQSTDFPGTKGGAQPAYAGLGDVFVVKMTMDLLASPTPPIPTLQQGALLLLVVLLAGCGAWGLPRIRFKSYSR